MVKAGVTAQFATSKSSYPPGEMLQATLQLTNSGVGHYFQTYVTPQVVARFELVDKRGKPLKGTQKEAMIGHEVPLDLSREPFDTRIWSHVDGEAVTGPLRGTKLQMLPATRTDWGTWKRLHPDTLVLDPRKSPHRRDYSIDPYEGYY